MPYTPPKYPGAIPTQSGDDPDLPDRVDDVDWLDAARYNELKKELLAALTELGVNPKGGYASVAARLDALTPKTELDYMEYPSNGQAQAAYKSSDSEIAYTLEEERNVAVDNHVGLSTSGAGGLELDLLAYPFIPSGSYNIAKVEVHLRKVNSPTGNVWTELWSDNGSDDPDEQLGSDSSTKAASALQASDTFEAFTFASFIPDTNGTKLFLVLNDDRAKDDTNKVEWAGNAAAESTKGHYYQTPTWSNWGDVNFNFKIYSGVTPLQCYSEATIKSQGSYSLKGVAAPTVSLNETLTRTVSPVIDLTGKTTIKFDIRSNRTGANIKIAIHDSGGTTSEKTHTIAQADTWETVTWDISAIAAANKDAIDSIIITIINADAENTFYVDNMYAK